MVSVMCRNPEMKYYTMKRGDQGATLTRRSSGIQFGLLESVSGSQTDINQKPALSKEKEEAWKLPSTMKASLYTQLWKHDTALNY